MVASGGIPGPLAVLAQKVRKVVLRPRFLKVQLEVVNYATQTGISTFGSLHTYTGFLGVSSVTQVTVKVVSDRVIY